MNKQEAEKAHANTCKRSFLQLALVLAATLLIGADFDAFTPPWLVGLVVATWLVCTLIVLYAQGRAHMWIEAQADGKDRKE